MDIGNCIICGRKIEWTNGRRNHHCDKIVETRIEAGRTGAGNRQHNRELSEAQRLNYGFYILNLEENW